LDNFKKAANKSFFLHPISKSQSKDTGMAMVLIVLIAGYLTQKKYFFALSIPILILNMIWPPFFRPLAIFWFGVSHILGTIMSKIILTLLYFLLVTPVGCIRRIFRIDSLQLKKWKKDDSSVFQIRQHKIKPEDITKPF